MTHLDNVYADVVLASLLDGKVSVQTSKNASHLIKAYSDNERPNKLLADELIDVEWNGNVQSLTTPIGLLSGNLMLTIWCKTHPDGRAKKKLVRQIVNQCVELVNGAISHGFYFSLNPLNVITPTTINLTTGYSTTILNVEWHTTDDL